MVLTQVLAVSADTNDLYLGPDGNIVVFSGIEAIVQACKTACQTQLGECVLQQGQGLPNFQLIWVGTPDYALWQSYLENTILAVDGVNSVSEIQLSVSNNTLNYSALIVTEISPLAFPVSGAISTSGG